MSLPEIDALRSALARGADVRQSSHGFYQAAVRSDPETRDALLTALGPLIAESEHDVAGPLAIIAGAIVEDGADPRAFPGQVFDCLLRHLETIEGPDDERELDEGYYLLERAAMACLSRSVELRGSLPQKPRLRKAIQRYSEQYGFLGKMLAVLDGDPLVVLHPSTARGFRFRIGGIADNFQLHSLLIEKLAGDAPDRIPNPGAGTSNSNWQLANWTGLRSDLGIETKNYQRDWIWNEGVPEDIAVFEGTRIVLIGPSTIARSWNAGRVFDGMAAVLDLEGLMTLDEVEKLIGRIQNARRPS